MRGKIIHYNANEGKGLILAESKQFPFDITSWVSDSAPMVNSTVNFELDENSLPKFINRVGDDVLLKEKANDVARRLSSAAAGPTSEQTGGGVPVSAVTTPAAESFSVERVLSTLGREALGAQALFIVAALFLPFVRTPAIMGVASKDMTAYEFAGSSIFNSYTGGMEILLYLSFAAFLVPVLWRNKLAWLALCAPAAAAIRGFMAIRKATAEMDVGNDVIRAFMGADNARKLMSELGADLKFGMGYGFWILIASAAVLAYFGVTRYRQLS